MTEVRQIDLVFLCDCTGSMGSYIAEAQKSIKSIITALQASEKADLRFALICYRDHPPQDISYVTKVFPFTESVKTAQENVNTMAASGGGDGPECIACAMKDILGLDFRKEALKVVVMISDAPPHGLTRSGDGFPDGCPDGNDPMEITQRLKERGIICYTVGVEPSVSYGMTREFLRAVAKISGGRYVPLSGSSSLPDVILYGTTEELDLKKLQKQIEEEEAEIKKELGADAPEDKIDAELEARLQKKGVEIRRLDISGFDEGKGQEHVDEISKKMSMMSVQSYITSVNPALGGSSPSPFGLYGAYPTPPMPPTTPYGFAPSSGPGYAPSIASAVPSSSPYPPPAISSPAAYGLFGAPAPGLPIAPIAYATPTSFPGYSTPSAPSPSVPSAPTFACSPSYSSAAPYGLTSLPTPAVPAASPATTPAAYGAASPAVSAPYPTSSFAAPTSYGYAQVQSSVSMSDIRKVKSRFH